MSRSILDAFTDDACAVCGAEPGALLQLVSRYVTRHLPEEEARLRGARYPQLDAHLREHEELRILYSDLLKAYARHGDEAAVRGDVCARVRRWLEAHALADQAFAAFLRGVASEPG
jgi:hemerythrin-like metal-binding protein